MKVETATGLIAGYMRACNFHGWASFWGTVYIMPGWEGYQPLLRHEKKHLEQIERDGRLRFAIKYAWLTLRHGYWSNPYEIEARAAELIPPSLPAQ